MHHLLNIIIIKTYLNRYYKLPTGEQKLVNVARPEHGHQLIEFYDEPEDYILGIEGAGASISII